MKEDKVKRANLLISFVVQVVPNGVSIASIRPKKVLA